MANWISPVAKQLHSVTARADYGRYGLRIGREIGRTSRKTLFVVDSPASATGVKSPLRDARLTRLEAILLLAREPLSTRKLSQYANLADGTEARTLIRQLNERYDQSGRAFRVEEVAGGYQLLTRPKFATWLRRLEHVPKETRLSAPALETLAVIAYCQPTGRAEIEAIRGVNCGEMLKQLMDRELVKIAGRSDDLGRPYLYATTRRFLQLFGLKNLDELPRAAQFKIDQIHKSTTEILNSTIHASDSPERIEEEPDVTATIRAEQAPEELKKLRAGNLTVISPRAIDEEEEELDDTDDADDDEEDDLEDDEDDLEDEEFDEVDDDLDDEDDLEDDEDDEWEEVEDDDEEDEDWEEDDDEDDDWEEDDDEEEEEDEKDAGWE
jgi:segregation and condensation protein B